MTHDSISYRSYGGVIRVSTMGKTFPTVAMNTVSIIGRYHRSYGSYHRNIFPTVAMKTVSIVGRYMVHFVTTV